MKKQVLLLFQTSVFFVLSTHAQIISTSVNLNFKNSSDDMPVMRTKVYVVQEDDTIASGFSDDKGIFSFQTELDITGIDDYFADQQEIFISPNPVSGNEVVISSGSHSFTESENHIRIYDLSGKVYSKYEHFSPGSYIIRIEEPGSGFLSSGNFIITRPGYYNFRFKNSSTGNDDKKATDNEGTPYLVYAEKSEFVTFHDTVYILSEQKDYVIALNKAEQPTPFFFVSGTLKVGETIIFDGSESVGAVEEDLKYTWNFGDGVNSGGEKAAHIYTEPGTYNVYLTAVGNYGAKDTLLETIEIAAANPPADTALISAYVSSPDGLPIEGVTITVSGINEEFITNEQGEAELKAGVNTDVTIKIMKEGYTSQVQYLNLENGSEFGDHYFTIIPRENPVTIAEVEFGFEYASSSGVKVFVPVEGLVDQDGDIVTGDIALSLTPVDVSDRITKVE